MALLATVGSPFEARVIAARLGADGIVVELRPPGTGPYPFGETKLYVEEGAFSVARQLLLPVEIPLDEPETAANAFGAAWYRRRWVKAAALASLVAAGVARAW